MAKTQRRAHVACPIECPLISNVVVGESYGTYISLCEKVAHKRHAETCCHQSLRSPSPSPPCHRPFRRVLVWVSLPQQPLAVRANCDSAVCAMLVLLSLLGTHTSTLHDTQSDSRTAWRSSTPLPPLWLCDCSSAAAAAAAQGSANDGFDRLTLAD